MKKSKKKDPKKAGKAHAKAEAATSKAVTTTDGDGASANATTSAGEKKGRTSKAKGEAKPKRVSALDAAAQVLAKAGKPMRAQDLIAAMAEQGLWTSPGGKTPHATLYAAMLREARDKGKDARFTKVDRGMFGFNRKEA